MIYTHLNPDLDNIFSTITYCLTNIINIDSDNIKFVPANQKEFPQDSILIDLEINKHSATECEFMKYESLFPKYVVDEINIQDCYNVSAGSLQTVLLAFKKSGLREYELLRAFEPIVRGLMKLKVDWDRASQNYESIPIVPIGKYKFFKMEFMEDNFHALADYGLRHNIAGKVYISKYDMGIVRFGSGDWDKYEKRFNPDFSRLPLIYESKGERQWFQHKSGYLLSWGTYKAPATKFPRAFDNLNDFIGWLNKKFIDYKI